MGLDWPEPAPHEPECAELPLLPEFVRFLEAGPGARVTLARPRLCGPVQRPEYGGWELSGELSSETESEGNSRPSLGSGDSGSG